MLQSPLNGTITNINVCVENGKDGHILQISYNLALPYTLKAILAPFVICENMSLNHSTTTLVHFQSTI